MTDIGRRVRRGGIYQRLAEPSWRDPMDTSFARRIGGRWNPPGAFGALYLNDSVEMARLQVAHKLRGQPFGVEDLAPDRQHDLVEVVVTDCDARDCVSDEGLCAVGLPAAYPRDENGGTVPHARCQPVGAAAHADGADGVACRSAVDRADGLEELALFEDAAPRIAVEGTRRPFAEWFWGEHAERS